MRNIVYIILCICCNIKAQTNDTVPFVNIYTKEVKCSHIYKYKIINNSAEDYLTWLSAYPVSTFSKEMKIRCYFAQQHGDFNLFSLIYEELLKRNSLKVIGTNFIKRIPQGKSFTYKIKGYDDFKEQWLEHLVILKRKDVEEYIKFRFLDDWFYKGEKIDVNPQKVFLKRGIQKK